MHADSESCPYVRSTTNGMDCNRKSEFVFTRGQRFRIWRFNARVEDDALVSFHPPPSIRKTDRYSASLDGLASIGLVAPCVRLDEWHRRYVWHDDHLLCSCQRALRSRHDQTKDKYAAHVSPFALKHPEIGQRFATPRAAAYPDLGPSASMFEPCTLR